VARLTYQELSGGAAVRFSDELAGIQFAGSKRASILESIVMPTSVHLPKPLLEAVDRRARALQISRNQLVVRALEREVGGGSDWSPGFLEQLGQVDPELSASVDELVRGVRSARRSKGPRRL